MCQNLKVNDNKEEISLSLHRNNVILLPHVNPLFSGFSFNNTLHHRSIPKKIKSLHVRDEKKNPHLQKSRQRSEYNKKHGLYVPP